MKKCFVTNEGVVVPFKYVLCTTTDGGDIIIHMTDKSRIYPIKNGPVAASFVKQFVEYLEAE